MGRTTLLYLLLIGSAGGAMLLATNSCSNGKPFQNPQDPKIQHVVIVFQENRTPDNLFQDPVLIASGADIASSGVNSSGQTIPLSPASLGVGYDLGHSHADFVAQYDGGKMDGADKVSVGCYQPPCPANPQFFSVNPSEVQPYFQMAEQYAFGDRMFQTNEGPSFPAHQFIISGTSAPTSNSNLFFAENTNGSIKGAASAGCAPANPTAFVPIIDPSGKEFATAYPCAEHPSLTDQLDAKNLSWRYYTPSANSIWTAPNAIEHLCGPNAPPPNGTACVGSDWVNNVVTYSALKPAPILTDIANHQLPTVSWVIPAGKNSDHAGSATTVGGPSWVAAIVNAIGNSSYWSNTAIIVTWDDWGGWYDHVPPPQVIQDGKAWGSGYVRFPRALNCNLSLRSPRPHIPCSPRLRQHSSHAGGDFWPLLARVCGCVRRRSLGLFQFQSDSAAVSHHQCGPER
jgi:phospholipase C